MTVWFGVCADKEKETFFELRIEKGEVKVLTEEQGLKDFK